VADNIPAGAQRSPDGHYWWDHDTQAWQPVHPAASSSAGAESSAPREREVAIGVQLGPVHQQTIAHDDVVAMVERGGAELPRHEGSGEAYA